MAKTTRTLSVSALVASSLLASSSLFALPPGTRTPDQMVNLVAEHSRHRGRHYLFRFPG